MRSPESRRRERLRARVAAGVAARRAPKPKPRQFPTPYPSPRAGRLRRAMGCATSKPSDDEQPVNGNAAKSSGSVDITDVNARVEGSASYDHHGGSNRRVSSTLRRRVAVR